MAKRTSVVVSQSQTSNPARRQMEEDIVAGLLLEPGIDVTVIPNLYDLTSQDTGVLALSGISGNLVLCSWLFERAAHWVLDRHGIRGQPGIVLLRNPDEDESEEDDADEDSEGNGAGRSRGEATEDEGESETPGGKQSVVVESRPTPNRKIYCLDLRVSNLAAEYVAEIHRIHRENQVQIVGLGLGNGLGTAGKTASSPGSGNGSLATGNGSRPNGAPLSPSNLFFSTDSGVTDAQRARFLNPDNDTAMALDGSGLESSAPATVHRFSEVPDRRWYPVIDYSRCTNCMECIDFCLFGVYGVDGIETILVEQPDNCRKGCPACSRVCPANAIMFPQHKTPAIAGSNESAGALKIDLSQLFGAPQENKSAVEIAAAERDEQLMLAGRAAVGLSVGIPKRHSEKRSEPRDKLDELVDQLDQLDL